MSGTSPLTVRCRTCVRLFVLTRQYFCGDTLTPLPFKAPEPRTADRLGQNLPVAGPRDLAYNAGMTIKAGVALFFGSITQVLTPP